MINNDHYCIIDTETGGLSPQNNPICEIAFIILDNKLNEVARHERIIKNYNDLTYAPQALAVHGISMKEINAGMDIKDSLREMDDILKKFSKCKNKVMLVGHNMEYDYGMIRYAYDYCKMDMHKYTYKNYQCTMKMSHMAWGHDDSCENFKLSTLCEKIGVSVADSHRGLADVVSTVELFKYHVNNMRSVPQSNNLSANDGSKPKRANGFRF